VCHLSRWLGWARREGHNEVKDFLHSLSQAFEFFFPSEVNGEEEPKARPGDEKRYWEMRKERPGRKAAPEGGKWSGRHADSQSWLM
jgi:hypothetical protein